MNFSLNNWLQKLKYCLWSYIDTIEEPPKIRRDTDEKYTLEVAINQQGSENYVAIDIRAETYFGARHALDSLSQFWGFDKGLKDNDPGNFILLSDVTITDGPEFRHRGVNLDTSRNFFPKVKKFSEVFLTIFLLCYSIKRWKWLWVWVYFELFFRKGFWTSLMECHFLRYVKKRFYWIFN